MKKLISWTGWTKEDYLDFIDGSLKFTSYGLVTWMAIILIGMM